MPHGFGFGFHLMDATRLIHRKTKATMEWAFRLMKIQVRRSLFKSSIGASSLLSLHSFSTGCADQAHNHDNSSLGITVILSRKLAFLRIFLSTKSPVYCDWCNSILGVYPLALFKWITLCNPCPQMSHICF